MAPVTDARAPRDVDAEADAPVVIVLGMHRSGTSLCASVLQEAGIAMTGDDAGLANAGNVRGHFERWDVVLAHRRILERFGQRYDSLEAMPPLWWRRPEAAGDLAALRDVVTANRGARPWGFKDPRTMRLFRGWRALLGDMDQPFRLVLCLRRPGDVARSLLARDGLPLDAGLALWLRHHADFLTEHADLSWVVVDYDEWFADADAVLVRLLGFLDVVPIPDAARRRELLAGLVAPGLRRSHGRDAGPPGLVALYDALKTTCQTVPQARDHRRRLAARLRRACRFDAPGS